MLDFTVSYLEPGYTSFYKKTQKEKLKEFKPQPVDSKAVTNMENSVSEIYSPVENNDNFEEFLLAKL